MCISTRNATVSNGSGRATGDQMGRIRSRMWSNFERSAQNQSSKTKSRWRSAMRAAPPRTSASLSLPLLFALLLTLLSYVHTVSAATPSRMIVLANPVLGNATACGCNSSCTVNLGPITMPYSALLFQAQLLVEPVLGSWANVTIAFGPTPPLPAGVTLRVRASSDLAAHRFAVRPCRHPRRLVRHRRERQCHPPRHRGCLRLLPEFRTESRRYSHHVDMYSLAYSFGMHMRTLHVAYRFGAVGLLLSDVDTLDLRLFTVRPQIRTSLCLSPCELRSLTLGHDSVF